MQPVDSTHYPDDPRLVAGWTPARGPSGEVWVARTSEGNWIVWSEVAGYGAVDPDEFEAEYGFDFPGPWPPPGQRTPEQQQQVEQYEAAVKWLREKWIGDPAPQCPYCHARSWSVGIPLRLSTAGRSEPGRSGAMAPMFPVVCLNCGHTLFVSAVVSGITPGFETGV